MAVERIRKKIQSDGAALTTVSAAILLVGLYCTAGIVHDLAQIHIYRHDALYYVTQNAYMGKVVSEGRWLNYLLFPIVTVVPGFVWSLFGLASFCCFVFSAFYLWSRNAYYALVAALLFLQIPMLYALLLWPATTAPTMMVLLLAVLLVRYLNVYVYFALFGILFFGSFSNFYYLLPLLYLGYEYSKSGTVGTRFVFLRLLPAWSIGFVGGYLFADGIVYLLSGHFIELAAWRRPHYIHGWNDLKDNLTRSIRFFRLHMEDILLPAWVGFLYATVLAVSFFRRNARLLALTLLVLILMVLVHYVVVVPAGILISRRTVLATWAGMFAIVFFVPSVRRRKAVVLAAAAAFLTFHFFRINHGNLKWYATLTNVYYETLLKESPLPPPMYQRGIVLMASDLEIARRNRRIEKGFGVRRDRYMEGMDRAVRWMPVAREAGYKRVAVCREKAGRCARWNELAGPGAANRDRISGFYDVLGEKGGRLVISLH